MFNSFFGGRDPFDMGGMGGEGGGSTIHFEFAGDGGPGDLFSGFAGGQGFDLGGFDLGGLNFGFGGGGGGGGAALLSAAA